jgi:hypothetical protein
VVEDDVQDHADLVLMRHGDELSQVLSRPEMRIDVEEVLDPVAVVGGLERDLLEDRADPDRRDPEPREVAKHGQRDQCLATSLARP